MFVKEVYYRRQGGRPAVFCRFAVCKRGRPRETDGVDTICSFCDTDVVSSGPGGGKFTGCACRDARGGNRLKRL